MRPKTSRDLSPSPPHKDTVREQADAVIKDANKTDQADRDRVHGDGTDIGFAKG